MKTALEVAAWTSYYATALVVPVVYIIMSGNVGRGFRISWLGGTVVLAILSMPVFDLVWSVDPELTEVLPEGNAVVASVMFGWIFSAIIAVPSVLIHSALKKRRKSEEASNRRMERDADRSHLSP